VRLLLTALLLSITNASAWARDTGEPCEIGQRGACGPGEFCAANWDAAARSCPSIGRCVPLPTVENAPELALPIPSGTAIHCAKGILTAGTDSHNSCNPSTRFGFDLASSTFDRPHIVVASADGVARTFAGCPSFDLNHQAKADSCNLGFGNIVRVDHGSGFYTQYAHLSAILVHDGASVVRGQPIGIEGNSGAAGPKHIHWSLHKGEAANLPTAPTVPMPSISHAGGVVGAFDLPCGDWMQSNQPQEGTLLVSDTAAYESEAQFGFVATRRTTPPSQQLRSSWEYVLWGLSALVLVIGILFRRRGTEEISAGAYAALAVGVAAVVIDFAAFDSLRGFPQPLRGSCFDCSRLWRASVFSAASTAGGGPNWGCAARNVVGATG